MTTEKDCFEKKENACDENSARQFTYKLRHSSALKKTNTGIPTKKKKNLTPTKFNNTHNLHHNYTDYYAEESWIPYRSGGTSLIVQADRLGKTGADGASTSSSWTSASLTLVLLLVVLSLFWALNDGWVSFVSVLSWDCSEGQGDKLFKVTVTSRPLRWRTFV